MSFLKIFLDLLLVEGTYSEFFAAEMDHVIALLILASIFSLIALGCFGFNEMTKMGLTMPIRLSDHFLLSYEGFGGDSQEIEGIFHPYTKEGDTIRMWSINDIIGYYDVHGALELILESTSSSSLVVMLTSSKNSLVTQISKFKKNAILKLLPASEKTDDSAVVYNVDVYKVGDDLEQISCLEVKHPDDFLQEIKSLSDPLKSFKLTLHMRY